MCGRGFAPDPTGEAYRAPRPPSWFQRAVSRQGRGEGRNGEGKGGNEEKGRGSVPSLLYLQFNDCSALIVAATYTRSLDLALQLVCRSVCRHHAD